jgi:Putative peptidoglycan binding domain
MKKLKLLTLVGITSIALANAGWAAGHGGGGGGFGGGGFHGGGFGGGHFSGGGGRAGPVGGGGGFRGGGFHAAAPVFGSARRSFGVGARGGGVGMGGARFSGGVPNFAGAGPRFSSFGHPSSRQPVYHGRPGQFATPSVRGTTASNRPQNRFGSTRNGVGQRPAVASNRAANASAARSPGTAAHRGLNGRTDHIAERHEANWHRDWDRRHAHFFHNRFFVFDNGFWFGLDTGFYPWDYLPYYASDYYPYDYYTDVQPGYNTAPANGYPYSYYSDVQPYDNTAPDNGAPVADATVEATQERLAQLGYYNGPVDGIFGPATRDAVAKYQIDKQLDVTGSLSPDTLQSLGLPPGANN